MTQIVINVRHGGFGLSDAGMRAYIGLCLEQAAEPYDYDDHIPRDCPRLVAVVKVLGERANGSYANLKVVEIPDGVNWHIHEYDGMEHVAEAHRTWS